MNTYEIYTTTTDLGFDIVYVQAESTSDAWSVIKRDFPEIHDAGYSLQKAS